MTITCKNYNQHFKGHFCNHCGQSAETHEINFHFLWHDIQHGLFHFDNGILYTAKQLFIRQGNTIREFIVGKRVKHFKPISLVILLATVYGHLVHFFHIDFVSEIRLGSSQNEQDIRLKIQEWISTLYSWAILLTLPLYAFASYFSFRKQGYNFVEHLVLNTFSAGQKLFIHIATFPLLYFYNGTPTLGSIKEILTIGDYMFLAWTYSQFFNKLTKPKPFLLTILSFVIFLISIMLVLGLFGGIIYTLWQHH
jgi:Protein of unknown function (DUF3667)